MEEALMPEGPAAWGAIPVEEAGPAAWGALPVEEETPLKRILRQIVQMRIPGNSLAGTAVSALPIAGAFRNPITGDASIEQGLENLPVVGGTVGAVLGGPGGAALGATGGEAWRQNARRAAGLPAATGMAQRFLEADPNSLTAAVSGLGMEAMATPVGTAASSMLEVMGKGLKDMGLRSLVNLILHPKGQRLQDKSMELAQVMRDEKLVPSTLEYITDLVKLPFKGTMSSVARTSRSNLFKDANDLTHGAGGAKDQLAASKASAIAAGAEVEYTPVLNKAASQIPAPTRSGMRPELNEAQRRTTEKALDDAISDVTNYPGGKVPVEVALDIKERWDKMLQPFYKSTAPDARESLQATKTIADAWRAAIKETPGLEELARNLDRSSDLITITDILRKTLKRGERLGSLAPANEGRTSRFLELIPLVKHLRTLMHSPQWAALSAAGKETLGNIIKAPASSAQAWVRIADQFNVPLAQEDQPQRPEEKGIDELAKSIMSMRNNPPSLSEEEFIRKYEGLQ